MYVHNNIIVNVCARHIISIEGNFDGEQRGNGFGFQTTNDNKNTYIVVCDGFYEIHILYNIHYYNICKIIIYVYREMSYTRIRPCDAYLVPQ